MRVEKRQILAECSKPFVAELTDQWTESVARSVAALTFDDGPDPRWTSYTLDILADYAVHATFFVVGNCISGNEYLLERMVNDGHEVESHTWSHPRLSQLPAHRWDGEVDRTSDEIEAVTGARPRYLRPPYGDFDRQSLERIFERGLIPSLWSVDGADWLVRTPGEIAAPIDQTLREGAVVLLHDGGGDRSRTVAALPHVLDDALRRGLTWVRLDVEPPDAQVRRPRDRSSRSKTPADTSGEG